MNLTRLQVHTLVHVSKLVQGAERGPAEEFCRCVDTHTCTKCQHSKCIPESLKSCSEDSVHQQLENTRLAAGVHLNYTHSETHCKPKHIPEPNQPTDVNALQVFWPRPVLPSHVQTPHSPHSSWRWCSLPSPARCELVCGSAPSASSPVPPAAAGIWSGSAQLVPPAGQFMCEKGHCTPLTAQQYHHGLHCSAGITCHLPNYHICGTSHTSCRCKSSTPCSETHIKLR